MKLLSAKDWLTKYTPEQGDMVTGFYIPALKCAVRYDRSTGYFSAYALALAARGIEGLVRNGGRMRLVVGCTLKPQDLAAIQQGADLRDTVEAALLTEPLGAGDPAAIDALALLAWMVAKGHLDVKVAVPCDEARKPIAGLGLFHEKAGILEDGAGNRLAFCGSINETEFGWKHNWESFHVYTTWTGGTAHVQAEVEDYIGSTYNNAAAQERTAVGFVMTIYRRRLASSFYALIKTLDRRLAAVGGRMPPGQDANLAIDEDIPDDELADEAMDTDQAADLERRALALEETGDIGALLVAAKRLPHDTKAGVLIEVLREPREQGYTQAMVFTQYTDTMDFLRGRIAEALGAGVICFSGRGGEVPTPAGDWQVISRESTKQRFREGRAEIMVCTDAAAEGLNFQFCGALVNYDMPWNPMRVEQRIGRIDRLGQEHPVIRIVNLHYEDTVEADVYDALRHRINLFQSFVGRLQPILARLPRAIAEVSLGRPADRELARANLVTDIESGLTAAEQAGFDLDEVTAEELDEPPRPPAAYGLAELGALLGRPELLPPGVVSKVLGSRDWSWLAPGMAGPVRVTTDPDYFEQHPDSTELWSPGSPVFPAPDAVAGPDELGDLDWGCLIRPE